MSGRVHPLAVLAFSDDEQAGELAVRCIRCDLLLLIVGDEQRFTLDMLRRNALSHLPHCPSAAARAALNERTGP